MPAASAAPTTASPSISSVFPASIDNAVAPACNSVDPGPGIGTGAGQVNSLLCTTSTLVATDAQAYAFADHGFLITATG